MEELCAQRPHAALLLTEHELLKCGSPVRSIRSGVQKGLRLYDETELETCKLLVSHAKCFNGVRTVQSLPVTRQKEMVCPGVSGFLKAGTVCARHSVRTLLWKEQVEETLAGPGPVLLNILSNSKSLSFEGWI